MMKRLDLFLLFVMAALIGACASLGVETPKTFNERVAVAQQTVTQVRLSATQLLQVKSISVADAENVLKQTDAAQEGVVIARSLGDSPAAGTRLQVSIAVLTALQAYLATHKK